MKFQTGDQNDIRWMNNPDDYDIADVVRQVKNAGKWDELLAIEQDEDGVVDCDALYDRLLHEAPAALKSVGLHYTVTAVDASDVVSAWSASHKDEKVYVSYCADGTSPSGLQLYDYGGSIGISIEFETVNEAGEVSEVSLDSDEVFDLVKDLAHGKVTTGAWNCADIGAAVFEMWDDGDDEQ